MHLIQPHSTAKPRPFRVFAAGVLFLAVFLTTAWGLDRVATPEIDSLPAKQLAFDREPGVYNVAFIGSSHVFHQVNPATFDAVCAEHGVRTRSFNLGLPGWTALQFSYMERWALSTRQPLQYLIIDPEWVELAIHPSNIRVQQTIAWHDYPTSLLALRILVRQQADWKKRLELAHAHAIPFIYHAAAFGRLQTPLGFWLNGPDASTLAKYRASSVGPAQDGFRNYSNMVANATGAMKAELIRGMDYLHSPEGLKERAGRVKAQAALPPAIEHPKWTTAIGLRDLQKQADDAGVRAVFITAPVMYNETLEVRRAARKKIIRTYLPFSDPVAYPQLYDTANQFDMWHLNDAGAEVYTRLIAERFVAALSTPDRPAP